jgi:hypothetical protein
LATHQTNPLAAGGIARSSIRNALVELHRRAAICEVHREGIEPWPFTAVVVATGRHWLILRPIRERLDFDGFEALHLAEVTDVRRSEHESFYREVVRQSVTPVLPPSESAKMPRLTSTAHLLLDLSRQWQLVALHREHITPDGCEVGKVELADDTSYTLREITPRGRPRRATSTYETSQVTRVSFGETYERTLLTLQPKHAR